MNLTKYRHIVFVVAAGGLLTLVMILLASQPGRAAGPWYVAPGGDDGNDCLSPGAACATINGALAKPGFVISDTILVATGTYTSTGTEVVLLNKSVTLSGGWDASFTTQGGTSTIDGEETRRGITVDTGVTAVVDRFTVQNGYTDDGNGGGIHNSGILTVTNSIINDNFAEWSGYADHGGGGIYNIGALSLNHCTVSNNTSTEGGGGIYAPAGSSTVVMDSQIIANTANDWEGGGVQVHQGSDLSMSKSWVVGNAALGNDGGGIGSNNGGSVYIENSIIAGNSTGGTGGGLFFTDGRLYHIVNSHIVGNEAGYRGAAIVGYYAQVEVTNTLIISNTGYTGIDDQGSSGAEFVLSYCNTYGNSPDGTNGVTITRTNCLGSPPEDGLDPLMAGGTLPGGVGPAFADQWMSYDYRLLPGSPAIDAGTPVGAPPTDIEENPRDALPDIGVYELVSGVYVSPAAQTNSGAPGEVVAHEVMVVNGTGATDSFTLAIEPGNLWTTTLSLEQTEPLPDGEGVSFTAWVEIPPEASPGESDTATIIATSVTSPTVFSDTATVSTIARGDLAYVTLSGSDMVALVDTGTHTVVASVNVGVAGCNFPWRATMSPTGDYVYVGCYSSGNVAVIETGSNTVATTVGGIPSADGIAFTHDGAYALVGSRWSNQIAVIDTATSFLAFISTPGVPRSIIAHPYLPRAYATCADGTILVIDTTTFSIITAIPVGNLPWDVAMSPSGMWVFASDRQGAGLAVIDTSSDTVYTTVTGLGDLTGLEVAPDGSEVYACGLWNGVHVVDGSTFDPITTVSGVGNAWEAAVSCDGSELYVGDVSEQIPVIDTATYSVADQITMPGYAARGIAICPQHVASGVFLSPPAQTNSGARGEVVAHQETLVNATGATDSFDLTLGSHAWDAALSTDSLGPIASGDSAAFTVHVTVPVGVDWYDTDTVVVTATSVTSPTVYTDTANFTTQAYAPPEIGVSPDELTSTQNVGEVAIETLTIDNGNGVPLEFEVVPQGGLPVQEGLVSWWPGEGDAADIADGNDGTLQGGTGFAAGKVGQAFSFDGMDDRVNVGNAANLHVSADEFTIVAWVKFASDDPWPTGDDMSIADKMSDLGVNGDGWRLFRQRDFGNLLFCLGGGGDNGCDHWAPTPPTTVMATTIAQKDVWYHVAGVLSSSEISIYVNGVLEDSKPRPAFTESNSTDLLIGANAPEGAYLDGFVDEVALFNRALTEAEIQTMFNWQGGIDAPWLSTDPTAGTVTANSSVPVEVTFDANGLQPDTYTADLIVQSNDPVTPSVSIPVTMTVLPTANMGWVEGTVTDAGTGDPLEATIVAYGQPYTITTNPDTGDYSFWLDEGSYTLQVTAEGYVTATGDVDIVAQQGTTQDFALVLNVPVIEVSPESLEVTHSVGDVTMRTLTIGNDGPAPLDFATGIGRVPGGAALEFDGTDDQLNMGHSDVLMLSDTDFTVEAWISTTTTSTGWILGKHDPGWGNGYGLTVNHQDCAPNKACFDTAGDHMAAISTSDVNDGQWHHIAGVYNVSGTKRIYIDGTLEDTQSAPVSIPANTAPFRVGYLYDNNCCEQYQGQVDEVRIWNVARTEAEIQSTMQIPLVGVQPGLAGYWKLDEGSGQTTFDSTAHTNNGQLGTTPGADQSDPTWFLISPQGGDVLWLTIDPAAGTVPAYSSLPVEVTFDATGVQPNTYTTQLVMRSNDPVTPSMSLPVTMTVLPTADMGRVVGTVSDAWSGLPLVATVELVGVYSTTASPDFGIWAPAGTYSLSAYTGGYYTVTVPVTIIAGETVTENLALEPAQSRLEWTPTVISATAFEGDEVEQTLTISNTGPLPLDIALHEINPIPALRAASPLDLTGKHILYDRAHGEPGTWDYEVLISDAISAGAQVTENWDYPIDANVLDGYDVLWVNCCGGTTWGFSELNAVRDWLEEGGAILVQGESSAATSGPASIFGIEYQSGACTSGSTTNITEHPISEGVGAIAVDWTCWRLAPGSGADVVVFDPMGQPHIVAQEQDGGKMVVVASEDFTNWYLDNEDNRLLANNILAWLARPSYSDVPWLTETPDEATVPGHSSLAVTLAFDAGTLGVGNHEAILAIEHNDADQGSPVEVPITLTVIRIEPALSLAPALQEGGGLPGTTVVYSLTVTNLGNHADTFSLEVSGVWEATLSAGTTGPLAAGASFELTLEVVIPTAAVAGGSDTATISAASVFDPAVSESAQTITTALAPPLRRLFLPLVVRNGG